MIDHSCGAHTILQITFAFGQVHSPNDFSIILRCLMACSRGEPVAGLPLSGRATSSRSVCLKLRIINDQAPMFAGSSCAQTCFSAFGYRSRTAFICALGNG